MTIPKFRAWSEKDGCWIEGFSIHSSGLFSDLINARMVGDLPVADAHWMDEKELAEAGIVVEMFTGVVDKNGKEIFTGDIVSYSWFYIGDAFIRGGTDDVILDDGSFMGGNGELDSCAVANKGITVIGNIHQNPELLKKVEQ